MCWPGLLQRCLPPPLPHMHVLRWIGYTCVHRQSAISTPFFECWYAQTSNNFY